VLRNNSLFMSIVLIPIVFHGTLGGQQLWSGVLAPARGTNWIQAGVPGGIPSDNWSQCANSQCAAVTSAGSSASAAQILAALQSAPANTYVLLGPGTYNLTTGICPTGLNNVELRGSGANSTILNFTGATNCLQGAGSALLGFQSNDGSYAGGVSAAYAVTPPTQGATTIVVPGGLSGATITPGVTLVVLDQCNTGYTSTAMAAKGRSGVDCSAYFNSGNPPVLSADNGQLFNCGDEYQVNSLGPVGCGLQGEDGEFGRPERFQSEIATVVSCSPSCTSSGSVTLTVAEPIIHPNWTSTLAPQIWFVQPTKNVGFKDFSMNGASTNSIEAIGFNNASNVWVQGVSVLNEYEIGIWMLLVNHASILDNYIYNAGQKLSCDNNACDPWGIKDGAGSWNLIQNNIVQSTRTCIATGEGPAAGDVVGYNLCINLYVGSDYVWGSFWQHANGDDFDLYEGNVGTYLSEDGVHGTHEMITSFRNLFTGWESCANGNCGSYTAKDAGTSGVQILAYNRYANVVGNVIGTPGITTAAYQFSNNEYYANSRSPYNIGSGNGAVTPVGIPLDPLVASTLMRWGNFDFYNNATLFCAGAGSPTSNCLFDERADAAPIYPGLSSPSTTLPASFYLPSKPSWFGSIPFPAIGPDVAGGNVGQCTGTINTPGQYAGLPALSSAQCRGTSMTSAWAGHVTAIPALTCYLNIMNGPPDGTGGALTFNRTSCYTETGIGGNPPPPPLNVTGTLVQ